MEPTFELISNSFALVNSSLFTFHILLTDYFSYIKFGFKFVVGLLFVLF